MPGLVLAAPGGIPTPSLPSVWTAMTHTWQGWDDSIWSICDRRSGVFLLAGVRGLTMPPVDRYTSESPAVAGSRWRGARTVEREVFWPLKVWNDQSSQDWLNYDRAWWKTMRPDRLGTWTVTQPDGTARTLRLRFVDDGGMSFDTDPGRAGWARYGITLVAEEPYWAGKAINRTWAATPAVDFFGGPAKAPSFYISSGHTLDNATITNPGDVDAWPKWTLTGPITSATIGVAGRTIEVPFSIAGGTSLTIDTDPRVQTARTSGGVDRTGDLGAVGFAPVPAGGSVPLSLGVVGTGSITLGLVPLWYRAW